MRLTLRERWSEWKYAAERELAPHVEEVWAEDFVVELRLQGVDGPAIGEALSEVESHCAESHERARHAFGDPIEYARSLGLPRSDDDTTREIAAAAAPTVLQLGGMLVTLWAFIDWTTGSDLTVTSGQVLSICLLGAAIAGVVCFSDKALRFVVGHTAAAFFAVMAFSGLSVAVLVLGTHQLASLPVAPVLVVSVATLLTGAAWQWTRTRSGVDEDVITSPLGGSSAPSRRPSRWAALTYLFIPVYTVLSLAFSWWLAQQ